MDGTGAFIVKVFLTGPAHVLALAAASFGLADVLLGGRQSGIRAWFREKWRAVTRSRWNHIPQNVIHGVIRREQAVVETLASFIGTGGWLLISLFTAVILFIVVLTMLSSVELPVPWMRLVGALGVGILAVTAAAGAGHYLLSWLASVLPWGTGSYRCQRAGDLLMGVAGISGATMFAFSLLLMLRSVAELPTATAALLMVLAAPFVSFASVLVLGLALWGVGEIANLDFRSDTNAHRMMVFAGAVTIGFALTLVALGIGRAAEPSAWVPQTLQMLVSNAICDGLTLVATLALLGWAVARAGLFRIPAAVLADVVAGALLASASLYFGLVFTDKGLSVGEVFRVLIARSPAGDTLEFGPYFWAMHTTFLPTLGYMAVIFVCWLGKAMLIPVQWFFGKGQELKNPLRLTAVLCTFMAALFYLGSWVVAFFVS
jgi:hypothetical protein